MRFTALPPNISSTDQVILFDGVCKLCNAWSNFIIKHDQKHVFKLCSVQSEEGQKILKHYSLPTDVYESMIYVEGDTFYQQSDAFFQVIAKLGFPWRMMSVFLNPFVIGYTIVLLSIVIVYLVSSITVLYLCQITKLVT
jgi:predicted DCC family thiol-disulfide oxidoreductase YuxK